MDLVVLILLLTKYFGLYWLFEYKVDYEYPARQLELTMGIALAHLVMHLGYALITMSNFTTLLGYLFLYVVAITMEALLWIFYDSVFTFLSRREYDRVRYFKLDHVEKLDAKIIQAFNVVYVSILLVSFWIQKNIGIKA